MTRIELIKEVFIKAALIGIRITPFELEQFTLIELTDACNLLDGKLT